MMEAKPSQSPHLKRVLKSYQLSAANTMSGPNSIIPRLDAAGSNEGLSSFNGGNTTITSSVKNRNIGDGTRRDLTISTKDFYGRGNITGSQFKSSQLMFSRKDINDDFGGIFPFSSLMNSPMKNFGNIGSPSINKKNFYNGINKDERLINESILKKDGGGGVDSSVSLSETVHSSSLQNGPSSSSGYEFCDGGSTLIIKSTSVHPPPIFSTPDRTKSEKRETILEGEVIACFIVGGEKRLCLLQILNSVLHGFSLAQINQVCDELQIFCSQCSTEQLEVLKREKVIPSSAHSCGLITRTDAERLVNSLLHRNPPKAAMSLVSAVKRPQDPNKPHSNSHFRIVHHCFGKGKGVVLPHLYEKPDSLCIECIDCHGLFSPQRFVSHSHHRSENRTCHWGFDSSKWRNYILVAKDQENIELLEGTLNDFKGRFDRKRKESNESLETCSSWDDGLINSNVGKSLSNLIGRNLTVDDQLVIKRIRYSTDSNSIGSSSPTSPSSPFLSSSSISSICNLPSKKRHSFVQQSETILSEKQQCEDVKLNSQYELETIKKLVTKSMGKEGAELINSYLDQLSFKISNLEAICSEQQKALQKIEYSTQEKMSSPVIENFHEMQLQKGDEIVGEGGVAIGTIAGSISTNGDFHSNQSMKKHILKRHGVNEEVF